MKQWLLLFLFIVLFASFVQAQEGSITLLALKDNGTGTSGEVVDLFLEISPGQRRVFLETVPPTMITTQISMRFAQQVACKSVDESCGFYDFFYRMEGFPGIIGGPSAGAAASVLAISVLTNTPLNDSVVITGTINSGGIIGTVGGVKEKIEAAARNNKSKVLIPKGTIVEENNQTLDLVIFGNFLGVEVLEVATLREAVPHFMNFELPFRSGAVSLASRFAQSSESIADELCGRQELLQDDLRDEGVIVSDGLVRKFSNLSIRRDESITESDFYSAASYCFQANVMAKQLLYANISNSSLRKKVRLLSENLMVFTEEFNRRPLTTLTDLQVWMAVDERLEEAKEEMARAEKTNSSSVLAYAEERAESAMQWASFFNGNDTVFVLDDARLRQSCVHKIGEAEERYSYISQFVSDPIPRGDIDDAYVSLENGRFIRCLSQASKVKASIDHAVSLVHGRNLNETVALKLEVVREALLEAQELHFFPIISYNYYVYAQSLLKHNPQSASLFAQYALEFSTLDIYFDERRPVPVSSEVLSIGRIEMFILGIVSGALIAMTYFGFTLRKCRREERKTLQAPVKVPARKKR